MTDGGLSSLALAVGGARSQCMKRDHVAFHSGPCVFHLIPEATSTSPFPPYHFYCPPLLLSPLSERFLVLLSSQILAQNYSFAHGHCIHAAIVTFVHLCSPVIGSMHYCQCDLPLPCLASAFAYLPSHRWRPPHSDQVTDASYRISTGTRH